MTGAPFQPTAADTATSKSGRASSPAQSADNLLGVQAGGEYWLIDLALAAPPIELPLVTPVPLTQSWFRGLVCADQAVLGLVDLSAIYGGAQTPLTHESRLVVLSPHGHPACALLVGSVVGPRSLRDMEPAPSSAPEPDDALWIRTRMRDSRGRFWRVLDIAVLAQLLQAEDVAA